MRQWFGLVLVAVGLSAVARADVSLPVVLSDGVVLQREMPIHVWGKAAPGESVRVGLKQQQKTTTADFAGRWHIYLAPEPAGGPYELTVTGQNAIVLHDVLIGDVWVASGQSNMEYPMEGWNGTPKQNAEEMPRANLPTVHLLKVAKDYSERPRNDLAKPAKWSPCSPATVREFSAVAYYFAKEIAAREKVPIGVIESTWGGTVAEAWTSLDGLSSNPILMPVFADRARMVDALTDVDAVAPYEEELTAQAKAKGLPAPLFAWHPDPHSWEPAALYNAMIAPLTPYAIRGVIWYQGESNSALERAPHYGPLFETLIRDWRNHWQVGNFPFLYVQISSFKSNALEDWAPVREAQRGALALVNTAMAVSVDIGNPDDVHPTDKLDVGLRLARAARAVSYGEQVEYSGPLFRELTREEKALRLYFDHADGMKAGAKGMCGFLVAGVEGKYVPATAQFDGSTIVVRSPEIDTPVSVRYAWENNPECPFFNAAGLPASPFQGNIVLFH